MEITQSEAQLVFAMMVYMAGVEGLTEKAKAEWQSLTDKFDSEMFKWKDMFKVWE